MIINGKNCRITRSHMSIFLDGQVASSQPILSIEVVGESLTIQVAGNSSAVKPQIHMRVPLPYRDWRLLDGLTFDDSFPGATCLAWCVQPQLVDMESFKCVFRSRSSRTFTIELAANLTCFDVDELGAPISLSVIEQLTLDSISVAIPRSSTSPVDDASRLLAEHLDLAAVSLPSFQCLHDTRSVDVLGYEVHFPLTSSDR